jgi:hypothetical protein
MYFYSGRPMYFYSGVDTLTVGPRDAMLDRLDAVRHVSHNFGYGVGDDMDDLLAKYGQRYRKASSWQTR